MKMDRFLLLAIGALALIIIFALVFGAAFFCAICASIPGTVDNSVMTDKNYAWDGSLSGFQNVRLEAQNVNGNVIIIEGEGEDYKIEVKARGTEKDFEKWDVTFEESTASGAKKLDLNIVPGRGFETRANDKFVSQVMITLPKNKTYSMEVVTVNGNIEAGQFSGSKAVMSTVNGAIESKVEATQLEFVNVNGDIDAMTAQASGMVLATTVNGDITVSVPKNSSFKVEAHAVTPMDSLSSSIPLEYSEKSRFTMIGQTEGYSGNDLRMNLNVVNGDIRIKSL